jgi:hypothetical protein
MSPIPISAAKAIADQYGYDQVIVIARKVGSGEHCTTYGVDAENCSVASRIGDFLKFKIMGWREEHGARGAPVAQPSKEWLDEAMRLAEQIADDAASSMAAYDEGDRETEAAFDKSAKEARDALREHLEGKR